MSHRSIKKIKTRKLSQYCNERVRNQNPFCSQLGSTAGSQEKSAAQFPTLQSSSKSWRERKTEGLLTLYSSGLSWEEKIKEQGVTLAGKSTAVMGHLGSVHTAQLWCWAHPTSLSQPWEGLSGNCLEIGMIYDVNFFGNCAVFRVEQKWETFP